MKALKIQSWFIRYRGSLAIGVMAGVLLSNLYILHRQNELSSQILTVSEQIKNQIISDNKARKDARKDSQASDDIIINYLRCIALIHPEKRTETNIQDCVNTAKAPQQSTSSQSVVPDKSDPSPPRQEPTTSEPPDRPKEPYRPGVIESINKRIGDTLSGVDQLITGLVR